MEERSASEAATAAGSVADVEGTAAASVVVVGEEAASAVEAWSAGVGVAAATGVSGVDAAASAAEASLSLLPLPQPQSDSDLDDETPPRTIGAAVTSRGRNCEEDVVNLPSACRSEVPNCRPWLSFRPERFCVGVVSVCDNLIAMSSIPVSMTWRHCSPPIGSAPASKLPVRGGSAQSLCLEALRRSVEGGLKE